MDKQEYKIWQTAKAQGKDDAFIKNAIVSYRKQKTKSDALAGTSGNQFKDYTAGLSTEKGRSGSTSEQGRVKFAQKVGSVVGGGKLAEGLGMAIAAPSVQKTLSEEQSQTNELQNKLLAQIRANKVSGKDTTRLERALEQSKQLNSSLADAQSDFSEALPTNKEVAGSSVRLAATASGGFFGKLGAKLTGLGKATSIGSGLARGAGAGAITGGVEGALQGAGVGLEQNKDATGVAKSAALGGAVGVAVGAPLGAVTGAVSGGLRGRRVANEKFTEDFVSPKQTTKEKELAIQQGRIKDPTFFRRAQIEASQRTKDVARATEGIVSPKLSVGENVDAIRLRVDQTDDAVRSYIQTNKVPFNSNQLRSTLQEGKGDLELVFASDDAAERTYDKVVDAFMRNVGSKDTLGLFEGRQSFDQLPAVKKLLNSSALGENAKKEIVLQVRHAANEYIASLLPQGSVYTDAMRSQHLLLEALGNVAEKNAAMIGKNGLQLLTEKYPLLKWLVGGIATGAVGAAGIGVGGALISSTD